MGMKRIRLMAVAFGLAAMSAGAATPAAQVYDVCLSLRTTAAAVGKVNNRTNPIAITEECTESIVYRKPTNVEWRGLIWGCDCNAIDGVWEYVEYCADPNVPIWASPETIKGCILWDSETKMPVYMGNFADLTEVSSVPGTGFGWEFIHAIGRGGREVEGLWNMSCNGYTACYDSTETFSIQGSGFGRADLDVFEDNYEGRQMVECTSRISYMIGKVSGWMRVPSLTQRQAWGCTFCGGRAMFSCEYASAWGWGEFSDSESGMSVFDDERTAVHGTWTLKYNEELSKKLSQPLTITDKGIKGVVFSIRDVYDFSELPHIGAAIESVENYIWNADCRDLAADVERAEWFYVDATVMLKEASSAYEAAKSNYAEAVSTECKALAECTATEKAFAKAEAILAVHQEALDEATERIAAAKIAIVNAEYAVTAASNAVEEVSTERLKEVLEVMTNVVEIQRQSYQRVIDLYPHDPTYEELVRWEVMKADAEAAYQAARAARDEAAARYENRTELQLRAQGDLMAARTAKQQADAAYETAVADCVPIQTKYDVAKIEYDEAEEAMRQAQMAYEEAVDNACEASDWLEWATDYYEDAVEDEAEAARELEYAQQAYAECGCE